MRNIWMNEHHPNYIHIEKYTVDIQKKRVSPSWEMSKVISPMKFIWHECWIMENAFGLYHLHSFLYILQSLSLITFQQPNHAVHVYRMSAKKMWEWMRTKVFLKNI